MPDSRSSGFTLRDMLVAVGLFGLLLSLGMMCVPQPRINSRRHACLNHMKQFLLALHNYHDVHRQFPHLTSTEIRGVAPGSAATATHPGAGYSWIVSILPYLEETRLYESIDRQSVEFSVSPFDPVMKPPKYVSGPTPPSFAAMDLDLIRCPSSNNEPFAEAPEYKSLGKNMVAGCSYVALSATHLDCLLGDPNAPGYLPPNGVLVPGPQVVDFRDITDGTSKTLTLVETREARYTSWYDGTVSWVVATDPNRAQPRMDANGLLYLDKNGGTALNIGPSPNPSAKYLPTSLNPQLSSDWDWGPSSEHGNWAVVHGIADGSVRTFTEEIDPKIYVQLTTRAGKEKANLPE